MKNKYQHNDDGTTFIFVESKNKRFPGKHTIIIDTEDWDKVKEHRWYISMGTNKRLYARTNVDHPDGGTCMRRFGEKIYECKKQTTTYIAQIIANTPTGMYTDHIKPEKTLDNRKKNLRVCTNAENCRNKSKNKRNKHGFKGVSYDARRRFAPWVARVGLSMKRVYVGNYTTKEEAAVAYDLKAIELHKEYASLNFPERLEEYLVEIKNKVEIQ